MENVIILNTSMPAIMFEVHVEVVRRSFLLAKWL